MERSELNTIPTDFIELVDAIIEQCEKHGTDRLYTTKKRFLRSDIVIPTVPDLPSDILEYEHIKDGAWLDMYSYVTGTQEWADMETELYAAMKKDDNLPLAPSMPEPDDLVTKVAAYLYTTPTSLLGAMPSAEQLDMAVAEGTHFYTQYVRARQDKLATQIFYHLNPVY